MPALRYAKNLPGYRREMDGRRLVNRVHPRGAGEDGLFFTMADHRWPVEEIDGNRVRLGADSTDVPLIYPDQVKGLWAREYGHTAQWPVESSDLDQWLELADTPDGLTTDSYIQFRRRNICLPDGAELTYLDNPLSLVDPTTGRRRIVDAWIDRGDVPTVNNLAPNPFLSIWTGDPTDPADFFEIVGGGSAFRNESETYRQHGIYSMRILGKSGATEGAQTEWIDVQPTAERPWYTAQTNSLIIAGVIRMEIDVDLVGDGSEVITIPDPALDVVESTDAGPGQRNNTFRQLGRFTHAGIGGVNLWDDPAIGAAKRIRVRLVREGDVGVFYWDAVMVTNTPSGAPTFYDRLASNELWHESNYQLAAFSNPEIKFDISLIDRWRGDPTRFPHDRFRLGGFFDVWDSELSVNYQVRVVRQGQQLTSTRARETKLEVTTVNYDLARLLNRRLRFRAPLPMQEVQGEPTDSTTPGTRGGALSQLKVTRFIDPDGDGKDYEVPGWQHNQVVEDDGGGRFTADIASTIEGSIVTGVDPKDDDALSALDFRAGSYRVEVFLGTKGTDPYRVNVYTVTLKDGGTTVAVYRTSIEGFYEVAS